MWRYRVRTRGDLSAVVWKDKSDVRLLTNIHDPPREGNYCDKHGNAIKPAIVADYNRHMGYVDNTDRMANSYTASRRTWKWTKKLFFHLLDLTIVNSYIFMRWEENLTQRFSTHPYQRDAGTAGHEPRPSMPVGRPAQTSTNIVRLDARHNEHWPVRNPTQRRCHVCSARGVTRSVKFKCL